MKTFMSEYDLLLVDHKLVLFLHFCSWSLGGAERLFRCKTDINIFLLFRNKKSPAKRFQKRDNTFYVSGKIGYHSHLDWNLVLSQLTWFSLLSCAQLSFSCSHSFLRLSFSASRWSFSCCRTANFLTSSSFSLWVSSTFCCMSKIGIVWDDVHNLIITHSTQKKTGTSIKYCSWDHAYLKKTSLGCDHQDVRVAFILHSQQFICWRTVGSKLERRAGATDLAFVSHVTKLVEFPIIIGHIISWVRKEYSYCSRTMKKIYYWYKGVNNMKTLVLSYPERPLFCGLLFLPHSSQGEVTTRMCNSPLLCSNQPVTHKERIYSKTLATSVNDNSDREWSKHFTKSRKSKLKIIKYGSWVWDKWQEKWDFSQTRLTITSVQRLDSRPPQSSACQDRGHKATTHF